MKQTKNILKQLEPHYFNIEYYHTIVDKIEENVDSNPDIAIESCKSLFEGLGKFIILNIDKSLNFRTIDGFKYKRAITKAVELLEKKDPTFESDFSKTLLDALDMSVISEMIEAIFHTEGYRQSQSRATLIFQILSCR